MNILLVEPDSVLARSYRRALQLAGHTVAAAADAGAALAVLDDQPVGAIILELQLARHSGIELLHELRTYPEWEHIPVILHTLVPAADAGQALWPQLGVARYLYKPTTSLAQLVQTVNVVRAWARRGKL